MKSLTKHLRKVLDYFNYCLLAGPVLAQIEIAPPEEFEGIQEITIEDAVSAIIKLILIVAAVLAFIFLIWGGIRWITSGGDKEQTASAQKTITAAVIGLAVVFFTWAIITLVTTFLGLEAITELNIPSAR